MPRLHLFEFEDQDWFPAAWRDYGTDFLQFLTARTRAFRPVLPLLKKALKAYGRARIVDLASGGGGGWLGLGAELAEKFPGLRITLTDAFPNLPAFRRAAVHPCIDYVETPVSALQVPAELIGLRTLFLAFHHLRPHEARRILQDALDSGNPVAIFEGQGRNLPSLLAMFFSPITVLLVTPFIRPFRPGRIFFTYLLPVVPLFVWWDGLVSALRTYSVAELNRLIGELGGSERFAWETGTLKSGPSTIIYLLGVPTTPPVQGAGNRRNV
jgi:hypothetical protein